MTQKQSAQKKLKVREKALVKFIFYANYFSNFFFQINQILSK